jgi:glucuronate isomerase
MAYLDENFLLHSPTARRLFHEVAKDQPIIDYHCHLSPQEIASNRRWENISDIWLAGDHYKWRLMRANGIDEDFITGKASPREKFQAWAENGAFHPAEPDSPLDALGAATLLRHRSTTFPRDGG